MENSTTEARNEATMHLDEMTVEEALITMNKEDQQVPLAVRKAIPQLTTVIKKTIAQYKKGGRLIYIGAGTSGRLGVLDAAECVPTFNTDPHEIIGIIAGGQHAMTMAVEGAEDHKKLAEEDLKNIDLTSKDVVIGIAASGKTPYVIGGLTFANTIGATTVSISCNEHAVISEIAQYPVEVKVGPEVLTGSTRLKSGTAQKLILNMISTITMVGVGKVYDNLMIDVKATNQKLIDRSVRIIQEICAITYDEAMALYQVSEYDVKVATVMGMCGISKEEATRRLLNNGDIVKRAIRDRQP
ncbi:TPA: N-acetylmuramic acid 6-phosphate etherase [Staphylococcus aureus]|uniref:N-acetylmuramic acid 6-phosphate etherase n=1 Tax=Staphylococcus aureus TaxID=1280 RepID=UPI001BA4086B|nr:N-acetylmuramic acid 6-phosphate etherase [Staphylococcus aureus]HBC4658062.1 N-acetylmuramic acid 6-phosphate etherase [Staphylococcus aureus]HCT7454396.1 N-acetylmuramic acid 6-phosphate etherase [Staphylococcus aureus]HCT8982920.1 N-acetylmuramic acid 6-phosphate etherase [Staphylococcus aureus]HCU0760879.1 N-acetylmuramic acid 6-phosphate etherase [Staphylococcus aureus]